MIVFSNGTVHGKILINVEYESGLLPLELMKFEEIYIENESTYYVRKNRKEYYKYTFNYRDEFLYHDVDWSTIDYYEDFFIVFGIDINGINIDPEYLNLIKYINYGLGYTDSNFILFSYDRKFRIVIPKS